MPSIALRLLGLAPLLGLSACDDDADAFRIYPTVEACQADYSAAQCASAYATAQASQDRSAPRYPSLPACEQIYGLGGCVQHDNTLDRPNLAVAQAIADAQAFSAGTPARPVGVDDCSQALDPSDCAARNAPFSFLPVMTGFLIGRAAAASTEMVYQPVYIDLQNIAYLDKQPIGTYVRNCPGGDCTRSSAGYVYAGVNNSRTGIWSSGRYSMYTISRSSVSKPFSSSSSPISHGSSILRGGFGSIAHAIGHIGS